MSGIRLELRGARRRDHELPVPFVQFAIRDTERVAREHVSGARVSDRYVVTRMAGRIQEPKRPSAEGQLERLGSFDDAIGRNRNQRAVHALRFGFSVNGHGGGPEA